MPETIDLLEQATLTAAINRVKPINSFIHRLLFSQHEPVPTENIELSEVFAEREIAPFVKVNGQSILIGGDTERFYTVKPPNIEIARALKPDEVLFKRRPGSGNIFATSGEVSGPAEQYIQRQIGRLALNIDNAIEWLCSQALTGTITYSDENGDVFTITYPRPAGHTIDLGATNYWDDSGVDPEDDILTIKELTAEAEGTVITDAIMSPEAARVFKANTKVLAQMNTNSGFTLGGNISLQQQFRDDGAILIAAGIYGINWWMYPRTAKAPDGTTVKMIRPFYVEFVSATPAAENLIYYGAISDFDASESGLFVGERFSKSWIDKRPSRRFFEAKSRPLPAMRRWGSSISMQVTD